MLDGQGGDEMLAGYHGYFGVPLRRPARARAGCASCARSSAPTGRCTAPARPAAGGARAPVRARSACSWLRARPRAAAGALAAPRAARAPTTAAGRTARTFPDRLRRQLQLILTARGLPELLRYEDRNSMAHSLEARVPFLDYRLVELCFSLRRGRADRARQDEGRAPARARRPAAAASSATGVDKLGFVDAGGALAARGAGRARRRTCSRRAPSPTAASSTPPRRGSGSSGTGAARSSRASSSGAPSTSSCGRGRSSTRSRPVRKELLEILADPVSGEALSIEAEAESDGTRSSRERSAGERARVPDPRRHPALRRTDDAGQAQTQSSFGFKWTKRDSFGSEGMQNELHGWLLDRYGFASGDEMREFFASRGRTLDAGCGAGFATSAWMREGWNETGAEWVGADISDAIDVARERLGGFAGHALRPGRRASTCRFVRRASTSSSRRASSTTRRRPSAR